MWETITPEVSTPRVVNAWLFYSAGHSENSVLITEHPVVSAEGGAPALGPGKALNKRSVAKAFKAMQGEEVLEHTHTGILPAHLLQMDENKITWYVPGAIRPMWFNTQDRRQTRLEVAWPTLLFHVSRRLGFRVWALAKKARPSLDSPLYHAPLANIYDKATVCLGGPVKGGMNLDSMPAWEEAIYETNFSHVNNDHTLTTAVCNLADGKPVSTAAHIRFWRKLDREGAKQFPAKALVPFRERNNRESHADPEMRQLTLGDVSP